MIRVKIQLQLVKIARYIFNTIVAHLMIDHLRSVKVVHSKSREMSHNNYENEFSLGIDTFDFDKPVNYYIHKYS